MDPLNMAIFGILYVRFLGCKCFFLKILYLDLEQLFVFHMVPKYHIRVSIHHPDHRVYHWHPEWKVVGVYSKKLEKMGESMVTPTGEVEVFVGIIRNYILQKCTVTAFGAGHKV